MLNCNLQVAKVQKEYCVAFPWFFVNFSLSLFIKVLLITKSVYIIFCQYNFIHLSEAAARGVLWKNMFLEISQNLQENTWGLWHRCFPVNFVKFLRTLFLEDISGRLLLILDPMKLFEVEGYIYNTINDGFHKATC